jgi:hypothetical protein
MLRLGGFIVAVVLDGDVAHFLEGHIAEDFAIFEDGFEGVDAERDLSGLGSQEN